MKLLHTTGVSLRSLEMIPARLFEGQGLRFFQRRKRRQLCLFLNPGKEIYRSKLVLPNDAGHPPALTPHRNKLSQWE
jgi:hypothetical protein